ncbi:MAG: FKBP-type peptidyl-prolyl cis-trans isomerase [Halobacteriales archaeon]|nr:FKBP-type peptidyl-prolyl cis-trans isomerase [Halobacteriales archaeon]
MAIESGSQVELDYVGRLTDGTVFDTSREAVAEEEGLAEEMPDREYAPLVVEVGNGRIIEGLEQALVGMEEGETDTVTIDPEDAYGHYQDDQIQEFDAAEFSEMLQGQEPEEGLYVQTQEGALGEIVHVGQDEVRVDFNHELAGETLEFEVEIRSVE